MSVLALEGGVIDPPCTSFLGWLAGGSSSRGAPVVPPTAPTAAKAAAEDAALDGDEEMPAAKIVLEDSDDDSWLR